MTDFEPISAFYKAHLTNAVEARNRLKAPCPLCATAEKRQPGTLTVDLDEKSYFRGYFTCSRHCTEGGYHPHFGRSLGIPSHQIPGFDPDAVPYLDETTYPPQSLDAEITKYIKLLGASQRAHFAQLGVSPETVVRMKVGFNGRYLVYPYTQANGLTYAARCIMPGRSDDTFWHGNDLFHTQPHIIYNVREIDRCQGGALMITVSEDNLLVLKQWGYPAVSVPTADDLNGIPAEMLDAVTHILLLVDNTAEAQVAARSLAVKLGFKARILSWPETAGHAIQLVDLVSASPETAQSTLKQMIIDSRAFSPFASPRKEGQQLRNMLVREHGRGLLGLETGFAKLDRALDGLQGITILGGPPKAGKSSFFIQIATELALRRIPVLYYDFENGRNKIYLRTLVRLTRLNEKQIRTGQLDPVQKRTLQDTMERFEAMLHHFRVVTDRDLSPELMRRHIDFLKQEARTERLLVVLDSLHKLPFRDLSERRTGIDFWLRQCESLRDEAGVDFLIVSELERGRGGTYGDTPDLGAFKASGDIAYSADNAMLLIPNWDPMDGVDAMTRSNTLWLVASREHPPGKIADYAIDYPFWGYRET